MSLRVRVLLPLLTLASGLALGAPGEPWAAPFTSFSYLRAGRPIPLPRAGERAMLTVEGVGRSLPLTRSQLQALPTMRYPTRHAQLKRTFIYEGVPLRDLAALGGFAGRDMRLYAKNGYVTTISARDYMKAPILLAYLANGRPIPVMDKGPLTVVLPDDTQRFPRSLYASAWVWYVERLTPAP